tara:strand:- start:58 stop:366 length:309 start_codon:yes stop_codon:yes gene_type:complete
LTGSSFQSGATLKDVRDARITINFYETIPQNASNKRDLVVKRCDDDLLGKKPTEEVLKDDLILAAYGFGADGVSNLKYNVTGGILQNCWKIHTLTGTSFRLK